MRYIVTFALILGVSTSTAGAFDPLTFHAPLERSCDDEAAKARALAIAQERERTAILASLIDAEDVQAYLLCRDALAATLVDHYLARCEAVKARPPRDSEFVRQALEDQRLGRPLSPEAVGALEARRLGIDLTADLEARQSAEQLVQDVCIFGKPVPEVAAR